MQIYTVDPGRSELSFVVRGVLSTHGSFTHIDGTVTTDEDGNPQSLEVKFATRSLNTRLLPRDLHLKTASYLDARRYADVTYRSQRVERTRADRFAIYGQLLLHGQEQPIRLDATLEPDRERDGGYRAHVTGALSRSSFDIPHNPILRAIMRPLIGDEVSVIADVVATPVRASNAAAPFAARQ